MLLKIGCELSFTENPLLVSTICSFPCGALSESRGTKPLAAFLRWLNKSSNAQAAQLKSYCGLVIARLNDFAIPTLKVARNLTGPKRREGCRCAPGCTLNLNPPELSAVASVKHCSILALCVLCLPPICGGAEEL